MKGVADSATPLILNVWYVAASSDEIGEELLGRWLLKLPVVMYRAADGTVVALDDRCPHRSLPLSAGRREGDNVICGYHGMTFAPDGKCLHMPPIARTPGNLRTRRYPVVERAPLVWIWLGDPDAADEALLPAYPDVNEKGWTMFDGYAHVEANYVSLHENLQDLSHFEHLHRSSIGIPGASIADITITETADGVFSERIYSDVPPPVLWKEVLAIQSGTMDRKVLGAFRCPSLSAGETTITVPSEQGDDAKHYHLRIMHFITPEFQHSTHYRWVFMRDFALEDLEFGRKLSAGITGAFAEDKDALESISRMARSDARSDFTELSFISDKAGIALRRRLHQMALGSKK